MENMERWKPFIIIGGMAASIVFFDVLTTKIKIKEVHIPKKYLGVAIETSAFVRDLSKKILMAELDAAFKH